MIGCTQDFRVHMHLYISTGIMGNQIHYYEYQIIIISIVSSYCTCTKYGVSLRTPYLCRIPDSPVICVSDHGFKVLLEQIRQGATNGPILLVDRLSALPDSLSWFFLLSMQMPHYWTEPGDGDGVLRTVRPSILYETHDPSPTPI
jgi:hypothetical protein